MKEISVTVTFGIGNEIHNHDLEYRETLHHVHTREDGVIELLPYRSYQEQINELMKPYIDDYNNERDKQYHKVWKRYNNGEIKTKPRKRDYKHLGYDYYTEHKDDEYYNQRTKRKEPLPIFRSIILGIGDRADRKKRKISEEQALRIFQKTIVEFQKDNPLLHVLGAAVHLDEDGFYHCHLDFKPLYDKNQSKSRGLAVGISFEEALEQSGYLPEQSIINGRDKAPIRFNALRNKIYRTMEKAMVAEGIHLQYGISAIKEPKKDSSRNQSLEAWQATQDAAREIQHQKNIALDVISQDSVSPSELKEAMEAVQNMTNTLQKVEESPLTLSRRGYKVTFKLFDQMKTMLQQMQKVIGSLIHEINTLKSKLDYYKPFKQRAINAEEQVKNLREEYLSEYRIRSKLESENRYLQQENTQQRNYMAHIKWKDGHSVLESYELSMKHEKQTQQRDR